jgi:sterol desaturase/sphingolipid hydroxylase (fatty acid hydroxylase superfamily)
MSKGIKLREWVEKPFVHNGRNLAIAGLSGLTIYFAQKPLLEYISNSKTFLHWGILRYFKLRGTFEIILALLLLDYTLYLWHVLTHRWDFLWRFHRLHHQDADLTATTGLRFHFGEMFLSIFWRSAQVILIGVSGRALGLWQTLTLVEVLFHHSNIRLPLAFEKKLNWIIVTPRMHTIHHSAVKAETNSNWSSGLTLWDYLHGTLKLDVDQEKISIGDPGAPDFIPRLREFVISPFRSSFKELD